jgi:hypothetical protein
MGVSTKYTMLQPRRLYFSDFTGFVMAVAAALYGSGRRFLTYEEVGYGPLK